MFYLCRVAQRRDTHGRVDFGRSHCEECGRRGLVPIRHQTFWVDIFWQKPDSSRGKNNGLTAFVMIAFQEIGFSR
jgi:hypothetical protein